MMSRASENRCVALGIVTILITVFAMALSDAFVKFASADMTLWQIFVFRSSLALPVLLVLAKGRIRPNAIGWVTLRSIALVTMYLAIYAAIPLLDLSVIAATLYTGPLFIVLLSAVFLQEPVGKSQWMAVGLGFLGVLFVVQPTGSEFSSLSLIPIIAAFLYAIAAVLTRAKCSDEAPALLAVNLNAALIVSGLIACLGLGTWPSDYASAYPFLFGSWSTIDVRSIGILAVMAMLIVGVSMGLARAYQSPHPQVIATFDYAYLIFAAFWGFVFFQEVPDVSTIIGIALIVMAGLLVLTKGQTPRTGNFNVQSRSRTE